MWRTQSARGKPCVPITLCAGAWLVLNASISVADEGGVSFWLPGQFGSFAAVPGSSGWSLPAFYYHLTSDASAGKSFPIGGSITAGIDVSADLFFVVPTYTLAKPVLGGQMALSMGWAYGQLDVSADATLTGPRGSVISSGPSDSTTGSSDLYPLVTIKWNKDTSNYLTYAMAGIPVGSYEVGRLANIGTNHYSVDLGGGYSYLNSKTGLEYSSTFGLTYNFENSDTNYRNGVDSHLDLAVAQFLSPTWFAGMVGYAYYQLTGDTGSGARLGGFKSRVFGVGPQFGGFLGDQRVYLNLRGYYEFSAKNRPEGWNAWLTLVVPLGPQKKG